MLLALLLPGTSLLGSGLTVLAGDEAMESGIEVKTVNKSRREDGQSRYEYIAERREKAWNKMIPRYAKIQFAGGMGMFSFGTGWDYGRKKQWESDVFLGFVPRFSADRASATFTFKQNYIPWKLRLSDRFMFEPLETGLYMNKIFSQDVWAREPEKYNGPYYRFSTNTRFSIFLGQRITMKLSDKFVHKSLTFFYEFSSNDLYLVSAFTNKCIKLDDILVLSFGLKFQFM